MKKSNYETEIIRIMQLKAGIIDELKSNSVGSSLFEYLEEYEEAYRTNKIEKFEMMDIDKVIDYIVNEVDSKKFDIKGWELYEIPIDYCFCFRNKNNEQYFDLCIWTNEENKVYPYYMVYSEPHEANSIQEAIEKYKI